MVGHPNPVDAWYPPEFLVYRERPPRKLQQILAGISTLYVHTRRPKKTQIWAFQYSEPVEGKLSEFQLLQARTFESLGLRRFNLAIYNSESLAE